MASVRLLNVVKRFEAGTAAVAGITMDIRDGEFVVLVGPSGCGKTTVLRLIAGLESVDEGTIRIGGEDVTGESPRVRDVAMVFQNYALYPHMSVRENIGFPLVMRRAVPAEIARRARDVADLLGIGDLLDRRPGQLSGGQRQRVALARAMVREPSVFLFDEPLSNLDAQIRSATRAELVKLHRSLRATMIYVTHDQVEALSMAQRVAVLRAGMVEQFAPPADIYQTPATLFTASFIGSPPINCLRGSIGANADGGGNLFRGALTLPVFASPAPTATLCVRPEDVTLTDDPSALGAEIILVEPLGAETIVHTRVTTGEEVRVRVLAETAATVGTPVRLHVAGPKALVYDGDGRLVGRGL
jgi:multiple sugar transport system ATP-binding protein